MKLKTRAFTLTNKAIAVNWQSHHSQSFALVSLVGKTNSREGILQKETV